jgi:hypothetical protein
MITSKLSLRQWAKYGLFPFVMGILVAWALGSWLFAISLWGFYLFGIAAHINFLATSGFGLIRATAECPIPKCGHVCQAGVPPAAIMMMEAHLAEVHEIYPGFTDKLSGAG